MERLCFCYEIKPGTETEYKKRHEEIWPDVVHAVKAAGLSNYTLFRLGQQVIHYVECEPDVATALATLGANELSARWNKSFEDIIVASTDDEGSLFRAEEIWHLEASEL